MPQSNSGIFQSESRGSILLYVVFLSTFLILFFASFQWEVKKALQWSEANEASATEQSKILDIISGLSGGQISTVDVDDNLTLISDDYDGSVFSGSIALDTPVEYRITATGGTSSLQLTVSEWAPILYKLISFNSGSESAASVYSSGFTANNATISLSNTDHHILYLESLGGYARYTLNTWDIVIVPSMSHYRLERYINGYNKTEETYDVVNFTGSYTEVDYTSLGMYFKQY